MQGSRSTLQAHLSISCAGGTPNRKGMATVSRRLSCKLLLTQCFRCTTSPPRRNTESSTTCGGDLGVDPHTCMRTSKKLTRPEFMANRQDGNLTALQQLNESPLKLNCQQHSELRELTTQSSQVIIPDVCWKSFLYAQNGRIAAALSETCPDAK